MYDITNIHNVCVCVCARARACVLCCGVLGGLLASWPEMETTTLALEGEVLTAWPPGKVVFLRVNVIDSTFLTDFK